MKAPQHIDFQWTTRGLYHAVFCVLLVVLFVLLLVMACIAYAKGWSETVAGFIEVYGFSVPGACLLFYLLDRFLGNKKTIYLKNDVLCFTTQKRGVIYEFPVQQIKGLKIWYVFQGIYLLTVQLPEGEVRIKLRGVWVWNLWKLDQYIGRMRNHYHIPTYNIR